MQRAMRSTCNVCVRRFLVSAEAAELPVAVVLNKADLVTREHCQQMVQEVCDTRAAQQTGAWWQSLQPVITTACLTRHAIVNCESNCVVTHAD